jgi:hypothetical protein
MAKDMYGIKAPKRPSFTDPKKSKKPFLSMKGYWIITVR